MDTLLDHLCRFAVRVSLYLNLSGFSWKSDYIVIRSSENLRYYQVRHSERICLLKIYLHPSTYYSVSTQTFHTSSTPSQLSRYMNINMLSIDYPVWVCLRPRLTLIRLALIRKPWSSGVRVSHPHYRYLCLHLLFQTLQHALRHTFDADWNAPLPVYLAV